MGQSSAKKSVPAPRRSGAARKAAPPAPAGSPAPAGPPAPAGAPRAARQPAPTGAQVRAAVAAALAEERRARAERRRRLASLLVGVVLVAGAVTFTGVAVWEICRHSSQVAATASVAALFVAGSGIWLGHSRRASR